MNGSPNLTEADRTVIKRFAENDMNVCKTGRALYMHRNTIVYHIEKVKKLTGLNPAAFYDLIELLDLLEEKHA